MKLGLLIWKLKPVAAYTSGQKLNFYFRGLLFTSHWLNLQHWTGVYIAVCGNFQGLLFYFRGLFFLHFGSEIARSPRVIFSLVYLLTPLLQFSDYQTLFHVQIAVQYFVYCDYYKLFIYLLFFFGGGGVFAQYQRSEVNKICEIAEIWPWGQCCNLG